MSIADRIQQRMKALGLKQSQIATLVGVSAPTAHDWTTGEIKTIKHDNLMALARVLQCRPEWLNSGLGPLSTDAPDHRAMEDASILYPRSPWVTAARTAAEREIWGLVAQLDEASMSEVLQWLRGFSAGRKSGNGK